MNTETITAAIQIAKALETETETVQHPLPENGDLLPAALVGADVLIRTVTMIYTGSVVGIDAHTIALDDAAWIADTGRFSTALATGELSEVEPYPDTVYISRSCVIDITCWNHALPRIAK
jgi:hypothetical protein